MSYILMERRKDIALSGVVMTLNGVDFLEWNIVRRFSKSATELNIKGRGHYSTSQYEKDINVCEFLCWLKSIRRDITSMTPDR